ncbi:MAG: cytochrome c biogenesis protein CcsA [candidate division Zixibacteria bacterium]|nr:cytochrome c biogenesis protein CcsA [candidate division Zixibacteria bacterium]
MEILGRSTIWLATAGAVASLLFYLRGERWSTQARWAFRAVTISLVAAVALLVTLILTHRYEFLYVRNYSSSDLPLYYLFSCLWGGQEGTLLLWIFYVSLLALILMRMAGRFERFAMATINLFILSVLLILLKRSPFETTTTVATDGAGLNPLLQDFWMTIHPPIMFFGFALSIFPFALAVSGWVSGDFKGWTSKAWVWLLGTWCTLGTALVMGGYWAYKVLGWGGYWAWDPVENSSLIPWLFASGGIHSMVMFKKKNALGRSAYLFCILPFTAVLFGSFLTRSGVLGDFSVHSFLDLGINSYLVSSLGLFAAIGFGVLAWRFKKVRSTVAYGSMSTIDFLVTVGVLSFLVAGALVLIGMSTPLWTRLGGPPSNVTLRYYFLATTPVALILLISLSLFPFMRWIKPSKPFIAPQAVIPFTLAMLVGAVAILAGVHEPLYILLLVLGSFAVASNAWLVFDRTRQNHRLPGAYIAHSGLALLIMGAAVSTAYEQRERVGLPLGEPVAKLGWVFTYQGKDGTEPGGKTPFRVLIEKPGSNVAYVASPRQFELPYGKGVMRKPAVKKFWNMDLYISPVDETGGSDKSGQTATLDRGQSASLGGFDMTFLGFETVGHGEGGVGRVDCPIEVQGNMRIDTLRPALAGVPDGLTQIPATFGDGRYSLSVEHVDATSGKIEVRLADRDDPSMAKPVFWVEISEKPLINLFWMGTTLMVFGGLLALRKRVGHLDEPTGGDPTLPQDSRRSLSSAHATTSVSAPST